jgi:hypothetical protein
MNDPDEFAIESIGRDGDRFEIHYSEREEPATVEYVTSDVDAETITDEVSALVESQGVPADEADRLIDETATAVRSYNEIRPTVEALFAELVDDGLFSLVRDSEPDATTIREWRREHPEVVDRVENTTETFHEVYRRLSEDLSPITVVENDFFDVHADLLAIGVVLEYGSGERTDVG